MLRPRDRSGKFAEHDLGITPFREGDDPKGFATRRSGRSGTLGMPNSEKPDSTTSAGQTKAVRWSDPRGESLAEADDPGSPGVAGAGRVGADVRGTEAPGEVALPEGLEEGIVGCYRAA